MAKAKKGWLLPLVTIVILLVLVAAMAGYFRDKIQPGVADANPANSDNAVAVLTRSVPSQESVPASVEARETTIISSRILARITAIRVRAGDYVEQGQLLLELESSDLLARAEGAQEQIRSVEARLQEARQNLARAEQLFERGLIAVADRDAARADEASLAAGLASARNTLEEAEAAVSYSQIRSPIAGRVVDRFAEPGDTASPGTKLLSLYNPFSLRVEARVREQLALPLQEGQELTVEIPSLERTLSATIEELVPAADPGSRSFMVKALLPSEKGLLPGMYARLLVPAGQRDQLVIPIDRVASVGQLDVVWIASSNGPLRRFVKLGHRSEDALVEVVSGLAPGDLVLPIPQQE